MYSPLTSFNMFQTYFPTKKKNWWLLFITYGKILKLSTTQPFQVYLIKDEKKILLNSEHTELYREEHRWIYSIQLTSPYVE